MHLSRGDVVFGRYEVERLIGVGGMGRVYRARHQRSGAAVALKVLQPDATATLAQRFEREARFLARVRHPNVVSIYEYGLVSGSRVPCIAMELIEGESIDAVLRRRQAIPWPDALDVLEGMLTGLDAIHREGILHRDLKPSNVMCSCEGEGARPVIKLLDFGIAKATFDPSGDALTRTGGFVGTPAYMAPEQLLNRKIDERTDLFAAAMVFYELVTGHLPFPADSLVALVERAERPPVPPVAPAGLPSLDPELVALTLRALAPVPAHRPVDARAYLERLRPVRERVPRRRAPTPSAGPPARRAAPPPPAATPAATSSRRPTRGAPRAAPRPSSPTAAAPRPSLGAAPRPAHGARSDALVTPVVYEPPTGVSSELLALHFLPPELR